MKAEVQWIPCSELLPENDDRVLVACDGQVWGATYVPWGDDPHWEFDDGTPAAVGYIALTHWARMPEAPKA